jgi:hypothetical protein
MSIRGLYDSEIGDRLARKSLAPFRKISDVEIDDEEPRPKRRFRKLCACGNECAHPYIMRGGVYVCKQCAIKILPRRGGHPAANQCAKCKKTFPRSSLIMQRGKLYCKQCEKEF